MQSSLQIILGFLIFLIFAPGNLINFKLPENLYFPIFFKFLDIPLWLYLITFGEK